jgi:hypothetical protein
MASSALPEIVETKETLAGVRKSFRCRVIDRGPGWAVLLFVSEADWRVHDLLLPAGTVTFGYFWAERPYNVYHWMTPGGATLALYVNLADATVIGGDSLGWRDLAVDVLIRNGVPPVVLDEHEIPAGLDIEVAARIQDAKRQVLDGAPELRDEIETASRTLWPRVFPGMSRR